HPTAAVQGMKRSGERPRGRLVMLRRSRFSLAHGRGRIAPAPAAAVRSWAWFGFALGGAMSRLLSVPASAGKGPTSNFGVPLSASVSPSISADAFAHAGLLKADASAAAIAFLGVPGSFAFGGG